MNKKKLNPLAVVRAYYKDGVIKKSVSYRRYKHALRQLPTTNDPEAWYMASSIMPRTMNEDDYEVFRLNLIHKAIEANFAPAMVALAEIYWWQNDFEKAYTLYEQASKLNDSYALRELGRAYDLGHQSYPKDLEKAKWYFEKAKQGKHWTMEDGFLATLAEIP